MSQYQPPDPPSYPPVMQQPGGYSGGYGDADPNVVPGSQMASFNRPVGGYPSQTVMVVNQQPMSAGRDWASGLCDCCQDMGVCCTVAFCAPCVLCNLSSRMGEGCCMPCCVPLSLFALRIKMRTEHKIQGSISNDHCVTCCCGPCALCQLKREHDIVSQAIAAQQIAQMTPSVQIA